MSEKMNLSKGSNPADTMIWNFKQLAQDPLNGFGNVGEGINMQLAPDGRRILWLAHESAPTNFTGVDVSDPRKPKVVTQTQLPHTQHALEFARRGRQHADRRVSDVETGTQARRVRHFRCVDAGKAAAHLAFRPLGTLFARRAHAVVRRRRVRAHGVGRGRFQPRDPNDDQCYIIVDVRNPSKPVEAGALVGAGYPRGDSEPSP